VRNSSRSLDSAATAAMAEQRSLRRQP